MNLCEVGAWLRKGKPTIVCCGWGGKKVSSAAADLLWGLGEQFLPLFLSEQTFSFFVFSSTRLCQNSSFEKMIFSDRLIFPDILRRAPVEYLMVGNRQSTRTSTASSLAWPDKYYHTIARTSTVVSHVTRSHWETIISTGSVSRV